MPSEFDEIFSLLANQRKNKRSLTLLFSRILDIFKTVKTAERAFLVSLSDSGDYRLWCSSDGGGRQVPDAGRSISNHAFMTALESGKETLFKETQMDRRFRTNAEHSDGARVQWIEVIPVGGKELATAIYLDSRYARSESDFSLTERHMGLLELIQLLMIQGQRTDTPKVGDNKGSAVKIEVPEVGEGQKIPHIPAGKICKFGSFLTRSVRLGKSLEELKKITTSKISVLLSGESGTGKELLAQTIHEESGRVGQFFTLHCGSVNETLAEVELFGHEKGAFTDAVKERRGIVEAADKGTLFLDAIDEASPTLQAVLLSYLQTGQFRRVGGEQDRETDVRILASVGGAKASESLRDDLLYRLAGFQFQLTPLRDRPEDVLLILDYLLESDGYVANIKPEIQALLMTQPWPGNGWQLKHLARHMVAKADMELSQETLSSVLGPLDFEEAPASDQRTAPVGEVLGLAERELILRALKETAGNKTEACKRLGISRRTLYRRMEKHGMTSKDDASKGDASIDDPPVPLD